MSRHNLTAPAYSLITIPFGELSGCHEENLDVQTFSRFLPHQSIPKVTAFKELSGEEWIALNEVGESGVLQVLELVNVRPSTGGKTRGSRIHNVFKVRALLFLSSSHSYDIVQTLALQECPTRTESPLQIKECNRWYVYMG